MSLLPIIVFAGLAAATLLGRHAAHRGLHTLRQTGIVTIIACDRHGDRQIQTRHAPTPCRAGYPVGWLSC